MHTTNAWRARARPLLYAHRGGHVEWPENSLEAFEAALAAGADVIETDAQSTLDGHVVLSHDDTGTRCARVDRAIRESTLSELKSWDLTAGLPARRNAGRIAIPTFDDALAAFPDALFNVDIKQRVPDMSGALLATIARHRAEPRVLLTSFDARALRRVRARYTGPTGFARAEVAAVFFAPSALLAALGPRALAGERVQIPVSFGPLRLDRSRFLDKLHALELCADYWVVNDPGEAAALLERGADGIVTDALPAMAELFARSPHTAGWRERHPTLAKQLCGS